MNKENLLNFWNRIRKYVTNKYLVVSVVFAVVFMFCGNQSLVKRIRNAREISVKEERLREYKEKIQNVSVDLRALEDPDSLERYAREHYHMHADDEDVYLIKE